MKFDSSIKLDGKHEVILATKTKRNRMKLYKTII